MALCVGRATASPPQQHLCSIPCHPHRIIRSAGIPLPRSSGVAAAAAAATFGARRGSHDVTGDAAHSFCTGWEVRWAGHGDHLRRRCHDRGMSSLAMAPSKSDAAGVTESGHFSQSDEDLASRGLSCHSTIDDLDLDQLNSLFSKVAFPQREKQKLRRALQNTQALTWVQETESKRLIGFARATGDKVFHAIIWDVVVDPAYQGLGLGKVLMERLMADLVHMGISNIALYAEPTVVGFYQPLGFVADPDGIRAMAYSRRR